MFFEANYLFFPFFAFAAFFVCFTARLFAVFLERGVLFATDALFAMLVRNYC